MGTISPHLKTYRFSELIETLKPLRIIHGIGFPHRQCQDIQIVGLALGPMMKYESLEYNIIMNILYQKPKDT